MNMIEKTQVQKAIYESGADIGPYKIILAYEVRSVRSPCIDVLSNLVTHVAKIKVKPTPKHTGHHTVYMMGIADELVILAIV